jgi:hypothetical protein
MAKAYLDFRSFGGDFLPLPWRFDGAIGGLDSTGFGAYTTASARGVVPGNDLKDWVKMLSALFKRFRPDPIDDPSELRRFVSGEASYLTQRAVYEFSRNTLAWYGQHYFVDQGFVKVYAACRWEAFGLLGLDMTALATGWLLDAGAARPAAYELRARMIEVYAAVLAEYPVPEHRPEGWGDRLADAQARLAAVAGPLNPAALALPTTNAVFGKMPVHSENKAADREVVLNALRFGLVGYYDRLRARVRAPEAARALLDGRPVDRKLEMRAI